MSTKKRASIIPAQEDAAPVTMVALGGETLPLVEICGTGNLLLDVSFQNSRNCTRSIPKEALRNLQRHKLPIPSPRIAYRVRLECLTAASEYFRVLLKPQFAEGLAVAEALAKLEKLGQDPAKLDAECLPVIRMEDEDEETKTMGREAIFRQLMLIIHDAVPAGYPYTLHSFLVLVLMADRYNFAKVLVRQIQSMTLNHKSLLEKSTGEEGLRQKVLILYHTEAYARFYAVTKEFILRGMGPADETESRQPQPIWLDLPHGLEAELQFRRACILRTIASIQNQFLTLYSSRSRQCMMGYDSSASCDSYQLGETVKFLVRKDLLSLVPFQAASPDDPSYVWPAAYTGSIDNLIGALRQCPSYQIDNHHKHCGFRTKLLPALDYIKTILDSGIGIILRPGSKYESWSDSHTPAKKPFFVGNGEGEDVNVAGDKPAHFDYFKVRNQSRFSEMSNSSDGAAKALFMADTWNWFEGPEGTNIHFGVMR